MHDHQSKEEIPNDRTKNETGIPRTLQWHRLRESMKLVYIYRFAVILSNISS